MALDPEIASYAQSLIGRYGRDAKHIANQGRLSARQKGDKAGDRAWSLILHAISDALENRRPGEADGGELRDLLGRLDRFANPLGRGKG